MQDAPVGVKDAPVADAAEPDTPRSLTAKAEVWSATLRAFESDGRADALAAELVALLDAHNAGLQESQLGRRVPTTPGFVRCCLRAKCYEAEKALKLAKNYATFRSRVGWPGPSVAVATNEAELRSGYNQLLPLPDAYGQTVVTQQMGSLDLKLPGTSIERYQRMSYYVMHRALMRPASQLDGFALLLDFRGFAFSSLTAFKLSDFRRGVSMLQDCFPARLTAVYVVHQPRWLSVLLRLIKPFLSGSVEQKLHLLGSDHSALHAFIPKDRLPISLGLGGEANFDWQQVVSGWAEEEAAPGGIFDPLVLVEDGGVDAAAAGAGASRLLALAAIPLGTRSDSHGSFRGEDLM